MADDDKTDDQNLSEDEKLAAEWEAAMGESGADSDGTEDDWDAAMAEAAGAESGKKGSDKDSDTKSNVRAAPMEEFGSDSVSTSKTSPDLDVIMDIPVTISMEVGNTMIPIRNLLQLNQGSVIELDRLAGRSCILVDGGVSGHRRARRAASANTINKWRGARSGYLVYFGEPGFGFVGGDCDYLWLCLADPPHDRHEQQRH